MNHRGHREHRAVHDSDYSDLTGGIIGAAIEVHKELGPGLLESAYEACLAHVLQQNGFGVTRQKPLPVRFREVALDCGYRMDLVVNDLCIVEIKAIERIDRVHEAQLLSYLRLADLPIGLLINFHVVRLRDGIKRMRI